ncbi:MAG: hypothetical protein ACHQKY_04890 [Terriglobia bacterium]
MRKTPIVALCLVFLTLSSAERAQKREDPGWFISSDDLKIRLPGGKWRGDHFIEIQRKFAWSKEESLLRIAESTYPAKQFRPTHTPMLPPWEAAVNPSNPEWWDLMNPGPRPIPYSVTAKAVRYYYDLSIKLRHNPKEKGQSTPVYSSRLIYNAGIKFHPKWTYQERVYNDVYVAILEMRWDEVCGNVCGLFYSRKTRVVLDPAGNVLALIIDPLENPQFAIAEKQGDASSDSSEDSAGNLGKWMNWKNLASGMPRPDRDGVSESIFHISSSASTRFLCGDSVYR